jgi:hypothetical protein
MFSKKIFGFESRGINGSTEGIITAEINDG